MLLYKAMVDNEKVAGEAKTILQGVMPSLEIARLETQDYFDWGGDRSLSVLIIARQRPPREQMAKIPLLVDRLRTWLAAQDDERFPYVRLITEAEELELQQAE